MKRFLKILALFLAPIALLLGAFSLALVRSGELAPTADIEAAALDGKLELFGLAYRDDTRALKQAVANARGADVLVLGTSRSMQLRGAFFASDSFYNAGGGIAYISQAQVFLENMPAAARPKQLLLVLDQYFYNEAWSSIEPEDSAALRPYTQPDAFYALRRALADYLAEIQPVDGDGDDAVALDFHERRRLLRGLESLCRCATGLGQHGGRKSAQRKARGGGELEEGAA